MFPKFLFLPLFFLTALQLSATTVTWTGNGNNNYWSNAANWNTNAVPDGNDDVILPLGSGQIRFNYSSRSARSIVIETGTNLLVMNNRHLQLSAVVNHNIEVHGTLFNRGVITLSNAGISGIYNNQGTIYNRGLIRFQANTGNGLYNEGDVYNRGNGRMEFTDASASHLRSVVGNFYNQGQLVFMAGGTGEGVHVGSGFVNATSGELIFETGTEAHLNCVGAILNQGSIYFKENDPVAGFSIYVGAGSHLENTTTGTITVAGTGGTAIGVVTNASLDNHGAITILNASSSGLRLVGTGTVINGADGLITIEDTYVGINVGSGGSQLEHRGELLMENVGIGILNIGSFYSIDNASITIDEAYTAVQNSNSGDLILEDTRVSILNSTVFDILNDGILRNVGCSVVETTGRYEFRSGTFTNEAWWINEAAGAPHGLLGGQAINTGIVVDAYDRFAAVLDNQALRITPLSNPQANVPYPNAFDLVSAANMGLAGLSLYPDNSGDAGYYNENTNTYTPNAAAIGATTLYLKTSLNGCTEVLPIRVVGGVQSILGNAPHHWLTEEEQEAAATINKNLSIFPNPTQDFINVTLSTALAATSELQIFNAQGRQIQTEKMVGGLTVTIDVSELVAGMYWVRLQENGRVVAQEKIVKIE